MPGETVDLPERVDALEQRVTRVEAMTEVVTAIRADVATIAEGVDPRLAQHVGRARRNGQGSCRQPRRRLARRGFG